MAKSRLDKKLARIRKDPSGVKDFIICDAKDGDMGGGLPMPGLQRGKDGKPTGRFKTAADHLNQVEALIRQDILDMVLLSVGNLDRLIKKKAFVGSGVGTAIRANDTTDIWRDVYKRQTEGLVVVERRATDPFTPEAPFTIADERRYGKTSFVLLAYLGE